MSCEVSIQSEQGHEAGCEHLDLCMTCGQWWFRQYRRFPMGPNKKMICFQCFDSLWLEITENLDIDWEKIEEEVNGV